MNRCASELSSFATVFERFNFLDISQKGADTNDSSNNDIPTDSDTDIDDSSDVSSKDEVKNKDKSIADSLTLLTDQRYLLIDAYPTLVLAYSIAMAIPITSCSAERSFSTLKRVKNTTSFINVTR